VAVDVARTARRTRSREDRAALVLITAMATWLLVMQAAVEGSLVPPIGIIQAAWLAIPAVLLARNVRGAAVVATVMTGVVLVAAVPFLAQDLTDLGHPVAFAWNVIALPLVVGEFAASIRAVVARRRSVRAVA
jgi:hypothetical protein